MNIHLTGRLLAAALLCLTAAGCQGEEPQAPTGGTLSTQEARAEQQCIEGVAGVINCATGNAVLKRTEKGFAVSGLDNVKEDGVSSQFKQPVTSWEIEAAIGGIGDKRQGLHLAARDGDQVISTLRIGLGTEKDQMVLAPEFTGTAGGSAYRMNVYNNGQLQVSTLADMDRFFRPWWWDFYWYWWPIRFGFRNHLSMGSHDPISTGACVWTMSGGYQAFSVEVDGKLISGDTLELVEEVGDGHYPYTSFSAIDVKAAAKDFTILSESIGVAKK
ncbi:hypothetical protein HPC49_01420 [Pyxidicoccus fallax]|uniref:Lipoprotein n=1 Tax=Pyxidicoccus fallax TaxID=394095 RepID=A0A848L9H3_9BACT|nr:hypothetical protein [Pyxidicoccus fallax]NMO15214.1 hypothetical protein [Pyxidicoccus fallax]NPC76913.1 hypothetical protein [Pyxidicoccus fallax]